LVRLTNRLTRKNYFDLPGSSECSCSDDFQLSDFKPDLFSQFASQGFLRLFALFQKSARQTPPAAWAKAVFEQQDTAA
jgi:hypothetical protein